jgi:hypothetical protein
MVDPRKITISIHAPLPDDAEVTLKLFEHLSSLAVDCEKSGWETTVTLTVTRTKDVEE